MYFKINKKQSFSLQQISIWFLKINVLKIHECIESYHLSTSIYFITCACILYSENDMANDRSFHDPAIG